MRGYGPPPREVTRQMPELPEVETVKTGLEPVMSGRKIENARTYRANLRFPFPKGFANKISGQKVRQLRRRAKYLIVDLANGQSLISHLGMSGRFVVHPPGGPAKKEPHTHVTFKMQGGAEVHYCDPRRFGFMDLCATADLENHRHFKHIGVEPLGNEFNAPHLRAMLKNKKSPIKSALLDQRVVAGLGNIYVCEALHRAGISPRRKSHTIGPKRAEVLVPEIKSVLQEAIAAGGSTLKDYAQVDGDLGYFQSRFSVYDREGEPCLKETCPGKVTRIVQSGRSTFFCSTCQR